LLVSVVYIVVCRLLELIVLVGRGDRAKELEILVLRHELSILRRQAGHPRFEPHDRLLLAALSRMLPRRSWSAFQLALPVQERLGPHQDRQTRALVHPCERARRRRLFR
jgi:putative transposase